MTKRTFPVAFYLALLFNTPVFAQVDVVYTGRLLGRMRFPDRQKPTDKQCETDVDKMPEPAMSLYKKLHDNITRGKSTPQSLLVGMGDNFAPDLFARTFDGFPAAAPLTQQIAHPGKDLFWWNGAQWMPDTGAASSGADIPMDNVGCFLRAAGYDAIVPGSEDFYFGPDRVRALAKFLYSPHPAANPTMHRTAMLGANLAIVSTSPDALARIPLYETEHYFEKENKARVAARQPTFGVLFLPQGDDGPISVSLPDVPMPWLREFEVDNAFELTESGARVNPADLPPGSELWDSAGSSAVKVGKLVTAATVFAGPKGTALRQLSFRARIDKAILCPNSTRDPNAFVRPGPGCVEVPEEDEKDKKPLASSKLMFELDKSSEVLTADSNWALCLHLTAPQAHQPDYLCQTFYVATPFFDNQRGRGPRGFDNPFITIDTPGGKVAIFGLLDPAVPSTIGRLNYGYWNSNPAYDTAVKVGGLSDALTQAWQRCQADSDCSNPSTRKVLLAQMPAFKASQFISSLGSDIVFDLVIAQPDAAHETGPGNLTLTGLDSSAQPNLVVTPGEIYKLGDPTKVTIKAQRATVNSSGPLAGPKTWTLANVSDVTPPAPTPAPAGRPAADSLRETAAAALSKLDAPGVNINTWSTAQVLQRLALTVMQKRHEADVSFVQARDLFEPRAFGFEKVNQYNLQETLDRVFWKGDFALRIPVSGASLVAIMGASAAFAAQDADPLNTDLQKGRSLATLGIFKEPANQSWIVNGNALDPAKLYSVIMSDYLALGDTGYPQLQTPATPPPFRMKDFRKLDSISAMVCRAIRDTVLNGATCLNQILSSDKTLDTSTIKPADTTTGFSAARQALTYLSPRLKYHKLVGPYVGQNDAETKANQKPFWSLDVEKGDFGLSINNHRSFSGALAQSVGQAQSLAGSFAGVQIAAVTAPNSYSITYDNRTRLKRSSQSFDFYVMDDLAYAYARTQDTVDDNYTRALSLNTAAFESGTLLHLRPRYTDVSGKMHSGRQPFQLDLLTALRFETQPLAPREDITLPGNPAFMPCTAPGMPPGTTTCGTVCIIPGQTSCTTPGLPAGTIPGTLERSRDLYGKLGLRAVDDRSWIEFGLLAGRNFHTPYELIFQNGMPGNNFAYLDPGQCIPGQPYVASNAAGTCTPNALGEYPMPPAADHRFLDWIQYLDTNNLINSNTRFNGVYTNRPQNGIFLNFSLNLPLPFGDAYTRLAGKGLSFLSENTGQLFFNNTGDQATETRYYDKLSNSLVFPVLGNLSFKPEIDLVYYRGKVSGIPFRSVQYLVNLSYTFSWRQGQPFGRALRFASPPPVASVPSSGR